MSMFDRSVSQAGDPRRRTHGPSMVADVRRGDLRREAKDQSSRYRKALGLPNQGCLFRHSGLSEFGTDRQDGRTERVGVDTRAIEHGQSLPVKM